MKPYSKAIVRVPQFPMEATMKEYWVPLKESIQQSAPDFFSLIKTLKYDEIAEQPENIQSTIVKYFNRAKFRCTPYGTFASVGIINVVNEKQRENVLNYKRSLHELISWQEMQNVQSDNNLVNHKLFANSSYYKVEDCLRYVKRKGETFELAEIAFDSTVEGILKELQSPLSYGELCNLLPFAEPYIQPLIDCGLLISENDPNLIGEDYFTRIGHSASNPIKYQVSEFQDPLEVSSTYFRHIPDLIKILRAGLQGSTTSPNMLSFMEQFTKRFDRQTVSLMQAIDPDIGIGYGNFYNNAIGDLIKELQIEEQSSQENPLLQYLNLANDQEYQVGQTIRIDELKDNLSDPQGPVLANSVSLFCSINDGMVFFDRIGGHSYTQLAGRFTICSEGIRSLCQEIACLEETSNPEVLFFDISYNAELNVDNVNRRAKLYSQELNILNYPGNKEPITLDDLYVTVSGSEIVLRSKKFGKRLIPRMASAYNYRRSKLPVFRFLYDLSFHGIIGDLSFNFPELVKGKKYYPQVQFRNIIVSNPKVSVSKSELENLLSEDHIRSLKSHLLAFNIGPIVKIPRNEESIVFDLNDPLQCNMLIREIKKAGSLFLENVAIPTAPLIRDGNGMAFNNQLSIPLFHKNELYKASSPIDVPFTEKRTFLPIQDWLYLEIYCAPGKSDEIILLLEQTVKKARPFVEKWFFIRYNEKGNHIRFRSQVKKDFRLSFLDNLYTILDPKISSGIISDISINGYNRELERYGIVGMERVEQHFYLDSTIVVKLLQKGADDIYKYAHCLRLFLLLKNQGSISSTRWVQWMGHIRQLFEREHQLGTVQFRKVRRYFQEQKEYLLGALDDIHQSEIDFCLSVQNIVSNCPERRQAPMVTDLMHMHINRLFSSYQRSHELIIFSLLDLVEKNLNHRFKTYNHLKSMI
ncbi:thiopeptide-type bacteriocin biosynthesis protein [Sphingobacterium sp. UGAL515B_05]|uniref:thiopeptide-type bacteriocin biosynthesis protein n=1 Tax=Sphingobacterium sp. UGAL515B_05 TaxID=2986767 RepID=UPI002953409C|nr:thiopeptide-type bacteriocin biosynthesis protein [Sphingobacterium sp. UGAL515B_05]WON93782.1 lantibiotic dehydratase [Sphingobacterium sp. UGAL515B_05]